MSRDHDKLPEALRPFSRALAIHDALPERFKPSDETPLREILAGIWPTVADLRALVEWGAGQDVNEDGDEEACVVCDEHLEEGDLVYWSTNDDGHMHAECAKSFVDDDGNETDTPPKPFPFRPRRDAVKESRVDSPREMTENRVDWLWYCESTSGVPVVTFGRWPKHPQQARYKLADIQPTEHDTPTNAKGCTE